MLSAAANAAGVNGLSIQNLNDVDDTDNPAENDILVYNMAQGGWHPQAATETAVAQLDDIGDVATYPLTSTAYFEQAVQTNPATVVAGNIVQMTFGAPFIDDTANPQNVFFVPNNDFITMGGRTGIDETTFRNANAVGPYNLEQSQGVLDLYFIAPAFSTLADAEAARDAINNIAGNAVAVTAQRERTHPAVGSIIHWVETNPLTGDGEWRYEVLTTHTNNLVDLDDLRDVEYPAVPTMNQSLVWNPALRSGDGAWEPRTNNTFTVRDTVYNPTTGDQSIIDLTRTVVSTRSADTIAPVPVRTGIPGDYIYTILTDSTMPTSTVRVQAGDLYVAGNGDLYYGSLDSTDNLVFREILHPASQSGRTIRLDQLPDPADTSIRQIIRWNPLASNNMGAWEIVQEEEEAISSIFDIADVDHRLIGGNPVYTFPDGNVITGARVQTAVNNGGNVDITFINTATGLDRLNVGDRVIFWDEQNPGRRETNGGQGFVIQAINQEVPVMMTIHSPDNMDISSTVAGVLGGLRPVFAMVTGTMGSEAPVANGDILQYHFEQRTLA